MWKSLKGYWVPVLLIALNYVHYIQSLIPIFSSCWLHLQQISFWRFTNVRTQTLLSKLYSLSFVYQWDCLHCYCLSPVMAHVSKVRLQSTFRLCITPLSAVCWWISRKSKQCAMCWLVWNACIYKAKYGRNERRERKKTIMSISLSGGSHFCLTLCIHPPSFLSKGSIIFVKPHFIYHSNALWCCVVVVRLPCLIQLTSGQCLCMQSLYILLPCCSAPFACHDSLHCS